MHKFGSTNTGTAQMSAEDSHGLTATGTAQTLLEDANLFREAYEEDVQFIFSRVQHHWHLLNKDGERVPMQYCSIKGRQKSKCCKRGFPKKVICDRGKQSVLAKYRARIVCKGVAAELDLKISGRRNMLGACACRRRCPWFASTSKLLAHLTRSNTNIQCPYRLPITATTHDPDCIRKGCLQGMSNRRLTIIAQRAMKTMAGYFGGYISKRQKVGNFEIRSSVKALPLLFEKLRRKEFKSSSVHLAGLRILLNYWGYIYIYIVTYMSVPLGRAHHAWSTRVRRYCGTTMTTRGHTLARPISGSIDMCLWVSLGGLRVPLGCLRGTFWVI